MSTLLVCVFFSFSTGTEASSKIGINYGRLGNNLPPPIQTIELIKSLKAGRVKLYDSNPEILNLLSATQIQVSIMVPNHQIIPISLNQNFADQWVQDNILTYYPETKIRIVLVGNEVLSYSASDQDREIWYHLVPAMRRINKSMKAQGIKNIKVGTPLAMDVLSSTFPPSNGAFRSDIVDTVIIPLLHFLNGSNSFFFVDAYPYFPWSMNPTRANLDFALFKSNRTYTDPISGLKYTNLLDQMLDSVVFATAKLGYPSIRISISETGWPNAGDIDQVGANLQNAAVFNRNLIKKITADPPLGTPARPGEEIPTFIFSLFNENQKSGPGTERHWGLLYPNGTHIYEVDLTGKKETREYQPLPAAKNDVPYKGKLWCVVVKGADVKELGSALDYACGEGEESCAALAPGKECYEPVSVTWHASYAFSSYWAQMRSRGANCYFNGLAEQTDEDPSRGNCRFPSVKI